MIYLVTNQKDLFNSSAYTNITVEESLQIMSNWDTIMFDTETSGRNPHICKLLTAQFGTKDTQIVVDCTTINFKQYKEILETHLLVGHNLKFDCQFLYKYEIVPTKVWDTMIVEQLLHLGYNPKNIKYSLQAVVERRLGIYIDKTVRGEIIWRGIDESVIKYAAGDVVYLVDIMEQQIKECEDNQCLIGAKLENKFVPVIAYLEWCGIMLDVPKWKQKMAKDQANKNKALEALNKWLYEWSQNHVVAGFRKVEVNKDDVNYSKQIKKFKKQRFAYKGTENNVEVWQKWVDNPYFETNTQGDLFSGFSTEPICIMNWNSQDQVIPLLQSMGFKTKTEDKKTGESKESMVEKLIINQKGINDEFIKLYYDDYQEAAKVCSTYGQQYIDAINPITNRIHTTFKQLGASSGRMSCGNSKDHDKDLAKYKGVPASKCCYVQMQNLPHDAFTRSCFISDKGNKMCSCDYSALESRLGADIYNEKHMIEEFTHGSQDIHSLMAATFFDYIIPPGTPTKVIKEKYKEWRSKAKSPEFLIQFGGGAKGLSKQLGCSLEEAKSYITKYYNKFKGIADFKAKGAEFVKTHGYVLINKITGHKVYWEDWEKWKKIEDTPEYIRNKEYSKDELKEHNMAGSKWERMSLNSPTQGSGIILLKFASIKFFQWILDHNMFNKVRICDMVHDELIIEYPEELEEVPNILKKCMEDSAAIFCTKLPIPAEPAVGNYWIH